MPDARLPPLHVDVVVVGAGTSGLAAYRSAIKSGKRVMLIEGGPGGTTCASVGCMPSKLLIAAAEAAHGAAPSRTRPFGVHVDGTVRIDGHAVMDRVRRERDRFVGFVLEGVDAIAQSDKLQGWAAFTGTHTLDVHHPDKGVTSVVFGTAVIATGSKAVYPAAWDAVGDRLVVNDDVFGWTTLPKSVAVFGPGVIGLELGQALHRLGVKVVVFGRGNSLGPLSDPQVRDTALAVLGAEFPLYPDAHVRGVEKGPDGRVHVTYRHEDGTWHTDRFEYLLAATGRAANVGGLNLGALGVALDAKGLPTLNQSTLALVDCPHVFMAGDVHGARPLLHEAADDGVVAGENAANYPEVRPAFRRAALGVVFCDPQMSVVGPGYSRLPQGAFVVGRVSFHNQGRARVMLRNQGALHVYVDVATRKFLGAEMVGPSAEHIGHLLAWSLQQGLTVDQMLAMPFYHPVVEEGLRTALRDALAQLAA